MSEQENQLPEVQTISATHRAAMTIGDDGRHVIVHRLDDGGYAFEWVRPDPDNGTAMIGTKLSLSGEALEATLACLFAIDNNIRETLAAHEADQAGK